MDALHQTSTRVRPKLSAAALMLFAGGGAMLGAALRARRSAGGRSRLSTAEPRRAHEQPAGHVKGGRDLDRSGLGSGSITGATSPNTGFSSTNPPWAPCGLSSSLQPGGTLPGGGPWALVGSLGTGGGQTASRETGSLTPQGQ